MFPASSPGIQMFAAAIQCHNATHLQIVRICAARSGHGSINSRRRTPNVTQRLWSAYPTSAKYVLRMYCTLVKAARDRPTGDGHANFFWKHFLGMFSAYAPLHEHEAYRCRCRPDLKLGAVTRIHNLVDRCLV